jgi:hypothetical protein
MSEHGVYVRRFYSTLEILAEKNDIDEGNKKRK